MTMTIANQLTLLRILLIPVFIVVFYLPYDHSNIFACGIFILAAVTDILDGYYARKLNQISSLGVFLDPVADKLMVAIVLVLLVQRNPEIYLAISYDINRSNIDASKILSDYSIECNKRNIPFVFAMGTGCAYPKRLENSLLSEKDFG